MDYLYRTGCIHNNLFKQMSADFIRAVAFAIKWVAVGIAVSPILYGMAKLIIAVKS
ncbi:Uncharacterised protein [Escherichia coli]|uniref:Uncharacterized protein n=2 Tax=Escherichia coli TaxID=562 RepID=A0A2X7FJA9_ECOLX|nr:Uncharacterised protein [Escherichia coli]